MIFDWLFSKKNQRISSDDVMRLPDASIRVTQQGETQQVRYSRQMSMLSALEDGGLNVRHSCRNGNCGACLANLVQGEVAYTRETSYPIEQGEVLMCACVPLSDVQVRIPEVLPRRQRR